jgi:hypothetical protein
MDSQLPLFQFDTVINDSPSAAHDDDAKLDLGAECMANNVQTAAASSNLPRTKAGSSLSSRMVFGVDLGRSIRSEGEQDAFRQDDLSCVKI